MPSLKLSAISADRQIRRPRSPSSRISNMADPNKSTPAWNFGSAGTTGNSSSLFGKPASDITKSASGIFGSGANSPATSGPSLFGNTSTAGGGSLFRATSGPSQTPAFGSGGGSSFFEGGNKQSGGLFGQTASQSNQPLSSTAASGGFQGFSTPNKPAETTPMGESQTPKLFGGASGGGSTGGIFSNLGSNASSSGQTSTTTPTSKPTTNFFSNSTTPAGPPPNTNTGASGSSLFSKPITDSSNLLGKKDESSSSQPSSQSGAGPFSGLSFGSNKPQESGSNPPSTQAASIFGSTSSTGGSDIFGKRPAQTEGGLFQNLNKAQDTGASKSATSEQPQNEAPKAPSLFNLGGQSSASTSTAPTSTASPFSFPKATQPPSSTPANPVTSPSSTPSGFNLFNKPASSSTSNPSTSAPLFSNLGKTQDKPPASTTSETAGTTVPTPSAPAPTLNLFSNLGKPSASTTTPQVSSQAPNTGAAQGTGTGNQNLGVSTSGPAPPAQSRLKNKSMDDIITRWASDLSRYQKEFQQQAEKVASWDRMLVDNSEKIQKLYGSTLEAERATAEVERQLTAVENDQGELAHWLDYYEKEVDSMISSTFGPDGALSGPDQERERT